MTDDSQRQGSGPSRRQLLQAGAVSSLAIVFGCGGSSSSTDGGANQGPQWTAIPDQAWTVGVPVQLDLAEYCTDLDGDALTFMLEGTLPPGVTLNGTVISGTPTAEASTTPLTVSADDGRA